MLAWHFLDNNKLRTGERAPKDGVPLEFKGKVAICESGLHASESIRDALNYAPGLTLCRVRCAKIVTKHDDKFVCRKRTILWRINEKVMRRVIVWWAYWCADRAKQHATSAAAAYAAAYADAVAASAASAAYAADAAAYAAACAADAAAHAVERTTQTKELLRLINLAHEATK